MNLEHYTRWAMPQLKAKDGLSLAESGVRAAKDNLAAQEAKQQERVNRVAIMQARHRSLNEQGARLAGKHLERECGLLDEFVLSDAPLEEFALAYDRLRVESRLISAA